MDGGNGDPYEERLLAVFNSCLSEGHNELHEENLGVLCDKLQLEERSELLISNLSRDNNNPFVSFATFRNALVKLLAQTEGEVIHDSPGCWRATRGGFQHYVCEHIPAQIERKKNFIGKSSSYR